MNRRARKNSRAGVFAGLEIAQSDLSMNVFITLLSVLSVLTLASSSFMAAEGFAVLYKAEETHDRKLALVRSWKPVLQINPHIFIKDGRAYRLDLRRLALAFAEDRPVVTSDNFDDGTLLLAHDRDPSAFRIFIYLHGSGFPPELTSYSFEIAAIARDANGAFRVPDMLKQDMAEHAGIDIFFAQFDAANAWLLTQLLNDSHVPYRLVTLASASQFAFERATSRFAFEDVYK